MRFGDSIRLASSLVILTAIAGCSEPATTARRPMTFEERKARFADHTRELLAEYDLTDAQVELEACFSPGVGRDEIPALTDPELWNVGDATYPGDEGRVVEVAFDGEAIAYPLGILAQHEIVNDTVAGIPIAVTYCPLCDSVSVVDRRLPPDPTSPTDELIVTELGVSGMLYHSNLVMYDSATDSLWSQIDLRAMTGPYAGRSLKHLPVSVVSFATFRQRHPDGRVMSPMTGHDVDYEPDQYAEYFESDRLYMPVEHGDALPPKTLGLGVEVGDFTAFITVDAAAEDAVRLVTPSGPIVVESDEAGMRLVEAPQGTRAIQAFYFAWSSVRPDSRIFGSRPAGSLLDGVEKSFVIVGYSTSYAWPDMLQDMLDEHAGGARVYHVLNAVVGGSPVERWIGAPESTDYARTMGAMIRDYFGEEPRLRGQAPEPEIALCQQSLQFTRSQRGPVTSDTDVEGITIGADAFETHATMLHDLGIERVYIATHIYKKPVEPEVGNERLALAAVLQRRHPFLFEGPDVWTRTCDAYPAAFEEDGLHPDETGMKMMAEAWYRTIADDEAKQAIVDRLYARDYDVDTMMRDYIRRRRRE